MTRVTRAPNNQTDTRHTATIRSGSSRAIRLHRYGGPDGENASAAIEVGDIVVGFAVPRGVTISDATYFTNIAFEKE